MSLVNCPECGRENVSDSAASCPSCGYDIKAHYERIRLEAIEQEKKEQEIKAKEQELLENKKQHEDLVSEQHTNFKMSKKAVCITIISVVVIILVCVLVSIIVKEREIKRKAYDVVEFVEAGDYKKAWEIVDRQAMHKYIDEETIDKAIQIGKMESTYEEARTASSNISDQYLTVVLMSIGSHQKLLDWGLYDYTEAMVLDSIQQIENRREKAFDGSVEEIILKKYNDPENTLVEPYRTENPDGAKKYIQYLASSIDENKKQEYEKEKYNKNNPLQITEKSLKKDDGYWYCYGTLSNVGSKTYYYVKVKVTYYDENMNTLTTDWTYAVDSVGINSGENKQFELMTKVQGNVEKYRVDIIEYK